MVTVAAQLFLVSLILVQAALTIPIGITDASAWHQRQLVAADVAVNINEASDALLQNVLGGQEPSFVREMIGHRSLRASRPVDTPLAVEDTRRGLFPSLQSSILVPSDGATLSGTQILDTGVLVSSAVRR